MHGVYSCIVTWINNAKQAKGLFRQRKIVRLLVFCLNIVCYASSATLPNQIKGLGRNEMSYKLYMGVKKLMAFSSPAGPDNGIYNITFLCVVPSCTLLFYLDQRI